MNIAQYSLFDDDPEPNDSLDEINEDLRRKIRAMPDFSSRQFIFGEGNANAPIAVIGESPGPPDSNSGRPFMGPTGDMLDRMLGAMGVKRTSCYITNVVKMICNGSEVTGDMLPFFTPFLFRELNAVRPRLSVALGNTPARVLLRTKSSISQLRGQFFDYDGAKLMPTFNPAYLLRDPSKKREAWEDIKRLRAFLATGPVILT
jgi:uracil-DNA glycosylase family 4